MTPHERNEVLEEAARCVENLGEPHYFQFAARMVRELKREESNPSGVDLIAAECHRQIEKEGWTPEHDDIHTDGELATAGSCYASLAGAQSAITCYEMERIPPFKCWMRLSSKSRKHGISIKPYEHRTFSRRHRVPSAINGQG